MLKKILSVAIILFCLVSAYFLWYLFREDNSSKVLEENRPAISTSTVVASGTSSLPTVSKSTETKTILSFTQTKTLSGQILNSKLQLSGYGLVSFKNGSANRLGDESWVMDEPKFGDLDNDGQTEAVVIINYSQGGLLKERQIVAVYNIMNSPQTGASLIIGEPMEVYNLSIKDNLVWLDQRSGDGTRITQVYQLQNNSLVRVEPY